VDERGGHTDFESFRCTHCDYRWEAEDEVVKAVHSMAAASVVVESRLTQAERSMYYQVLDALQAVAQEEGNDEEIG
jgi:hydroxyethylthiazole kinase-like sugar kinase family protein